MNSCAWIAVILFIGLLAWVVVRWLGGGDWWGIIAAWTVVAVLTLVYVLSASASDDRFGGYR